MVSFLPLEILKHKPVTACRGGFDDQAHSRMEAGLANSKCPLSLPSNLFTQGENTALPKIENNVMWEYGL